MYVQEFYQTQLICSDMYYTSISGCIFMCLIFMYTYVYIKIKVYICKCYIYKDLHIKYRHLYVCVL